jgi:hypothetical protein
VKLDLPKPIALYIAAENSGDTSLFDQSIAENATVSDESETYEGLTAIKEWKAETKRKYQHTVEPLRIIEKDGTFILTSRLSGNFPGSPIELDFVFTIEGDKIISLEILS